MTTRRGATPKPSARAARNVVARARSGGRRCTWLWIAASVVAAAAVLVVVIITTIRNVGTPTSETDASSLDSQPATVAVGANTLPPWPAPADATAAARAAGLPMLSSEGALEHIHAHLDVLVDGRAVPVPAGIGIDRTRGSISPLHTHDDSGVIHIDSPARRQFSLGEFFSEWQVSLSADNIGALRATDSKAVQVFVNGKPQTGNPAAIPLGPHDEIAWLHPRGSPRRSLPPPAASSARRTNRQISELEVSLAQHLSAFSAMLRSVALAGLQRFRPPGPNRDSDGGHRLDEA